jgi:hypothetical protein
VGGIHDLTLSTFEKQRLRHISAALFVGLIRASTDAHERDVLEYHLVFAHDVLPHNARASSRQTDRSAAVGAGT